MLFGYPVAAVEDNWLHNCLSEMLHSIHNCIQAGQNPPDWPEIIPKQYRPTLRRRTGLRSRLEEYTKAIDRLDQEGQNQICQTFEAQNDIERLLSCDCDCLSIKDLPESAQEPIKELFIFSFKLLSDIGLRDKHYENLYEAMPFHICPFCGCEYFDAPGAPREDFDHYLNKAKYPLAAANLRNLVPMGNKCNSKYKLTQDILFSVNGHRRKAYFPYSAVGVRIILENSQPFGGTHDHLPRWEIEFVPSVEESETWNEVFHIRERYKRDFLDIDYMGWLRQFSAWTRSFNIQAQTARQVSHAIQRYYEYLEVCEYDSVAFLKIATFKMIHRYCVARNQRLIKIFCGLIGPQKAIKNP